MSGSIPAPPTPRSGQVLSDYIRAVHRWTLEVAEVLTAALADQDSP